MTEQKAITMSRDEIADEIELNLRIGADGKFSTEEWRVIAAALKSCSQAEKTTDGDRLCVVEADLSRLRGAVTEAIELLTERKQGSPARSPGHNARILLERALAAQPTNSGQAEPVRDACCETGVVPNTGQAECCPYAIDGCVLENREVGPCLCANTVQRQEGAEPTQVQLRKLVDVVWNEATESTTVPSTKWADRLIAKVFPQSQSEASSGASSPPRCNRCGSSGDVVMLCAGCQSPLPREGATMSEALKALLSYQQADEDGVMVLASRQAIHEVADHLEKLRRTLESRSVRLMGPRSPFWQCEYCQALSQTPLGFKHKPECLMAFSSTECKP